MASAIYTVLQMAVAATYLGVCILLSSSTRSTILGEDEEETDLGEVVQYVDGDILIAVFVPITSDGTDMKCNREFVHPAMAEQVNLFLEKVNNNASILPGIKIGAIVINSCHSQKHSLKKLFEDVLVPYVLGCNRTQPHCQQEKRILAGVVGAAGSGVSMDLASLLGIFEISQAEAMADFIAKMGWNYVSVVYTNNAYGIKGFQEISNKFKKRGICIAVSVPISQSLSDADDSEVSSVLGKLTEQKQAKAVILFATSGVASEVLSAAAKTPNTGNISWIASDGWAANLVSQDLSYMDTVHGAIGFSLKFPSIEELSKRVQNLTIQDYKGEEAILNPWWQDYLKYRRNCSTKEGTGKRRCEANERIPDYQASRNALDDAMWVFVHALHEYHEKICHSTRGLCKEMSQKAGTDDVAKALFQYVKDVTFQTAEKRQFVFDKNQDGPPLYNIVAFDKSGAKSLLDGWHIVGTYDDKDKVNIDMSELPDKVRNLKSVCSEECGPGYAKIISAEDCCWVCQKCTNREYASLNSCIPCDKHDMPNDNGTGCTPIPIEEMEYDSGYAIACLAFGIIGLICTAIVTAMYWKHRDTAIVRASGRELCFLVLAGVAFTLLNCFTVTAHPSNVSCGLTRAIMSLGPTVIYAGLLMKTFRVVFIFQSKGILSTRTKGYLEPGPLIFLTLCVVLIQVIILTIWMIFSPPTVHVYYSESGFSAFRTCKHICDERVYVGLAYPFVIIIICTVLATINRNVPTGFRETLFVGFTMYTTCVTWIAFQALFFTNVDENRIERQLTTLSCALSISAITVLLCLFGPRCYTIVRHPELNTSAVVMSRNGNGHYHPDRAVPHDPVGTVSAGVVNKAFSNISSGELECQ